MLLWNDSDSRWEEISRNIPNAIPAAEQATIRSKLGLGDAANRTIGISAGQIPLIDNLGTAALVNTGVNTGQVPLANQLGSLAFLSQITDAQLNASGVTPGTYNKFTVNAQGRVTAAETQDVTIDPFNLVLFDTAGTHTYTPSAGVRYIEVWVTGGGGTSQAVNGSYTTAGGTSSFGSHCSGQGGYHTTTVPYPGNGVGGDINYLGGIGFKTSSYNHAATAVGGSAFWSPPISNWSIGGGKTAVNWGDAGAYISGSSYGVGAAGGTAYKRILASELGSTEQVIVGAGGTSVFSTSAGGKHGVVVIKEYF
jgi:hypothetical protein